MLDEKQYLIQIYGRLEDIYYIEKEKNEILNKIVKLILAFVPLTILVCIILCLVC